MFVTLTRLHTGDRPGEEATIVAEEMQVWLRELDGFQGFLMLHRPGTTIGLSFWRAREDADRARPLRLQFIQRISAAVDVEIEEQLDLDVAFANLPSLTHFPSE